MTTALTDSTFFDAYLARELAKAKRYGRRLAIVSMHWLGGGGGPSSSSLARVVESLRDADLATVKGDELLILLPETDRHGALLFQQRALEAGGEIRSGSAAFPEDAGELEALVSLARRRRGEEAESRVWASGLRHLDFWSSVESLVLRKEDHGDASHHGMVSRALHTAVQQEAMKEVRRACTVGGTVVICDASDGALAQSIWELLPSQPVACRILWGTREEGVAVSHPSIVEVPLLGDPRADGFQVFLFLSGHTSYGLIREEREGGMGFHTADLPLVRHLVAAFRDIYDKS